MVHIVVSRVLSCTLACSWLGAAAESSVSTCAAGQTGGRACQAPLSHAESRATGLAAEDENLGQDPALAFIQRTLAYKKRDVAVEEVVASSAGGSVNRTEQHPLSLSQAREALGAADLRHQILPCLSDKDVEGIMPLPLVAQAHILGLEESGLIRPLEHCQPQHHLGLLSYIGQAPLGVEDLNGSVSANRVEVLAMNHKAQLLIAGWGVIAIACILWSVLAILWVPRKRAWENGKVRHLNLADEGTAYKRGFFSWISVGWADDLVGRYGKCWAADMDGSELVADAQDLEGLPLMEFKKYWKEEGRRVGMQNVSILRCCLKVIGYKACFAMAASVLFEMCMQAIGMVFALDTFLSYIEQVSKQRDKYPGEPQPLLYPTIVAILLVWGVPMLFRISSIMTTLLDGYYSNLCSASIASVVFEKALNTPAGSEPMNDEEEGTVEDNARPDVVQLLNVDIIEVWGNFFTVTLKCMFAPFIGIILFAMLIRQIHSAGAIGFLYIIPATIVNVIVIQFNISQWRRYQGFQDTRMRFLRETMVHIRTIKALAWERLMYGKMHDTRLSELGCNQKVACLAGGIMGIMHTIPFGSMIFAMLWVYHCEGNVKVHQIIMTFRIIMSLLGQIANIATGAGRLTTMPNSFRRINKFLASAPRPENVVRPPQSGTPGAPALRINGSFSWMKCSKPVLKDFDVAIPRGDLVAVIGGIASGKSALCQTILGELFPVGNAYVEAPPLGIGQIAYCSQIPWITEGTLRENVLLGQALDNDRYYKCLHAAALTPDLQTLPGGDQVCIGSFGIRLSGGQRARVALARAAYTSAEVVVIDDPFASVDVPTGQHICDELLLGPLMEGRTRVIVMQPDPARLKKFDRVLLVEDGAVVASGSPADVMDTPGFKNLQAKMGITVVSDINVDTNTSPRHEYSNNLVWQQKKASEEASALREVETADYITWETLKWWVRSGGYGNISVFVALVLLQRWIVLQESLAVSVWIDDKMMHIAGDDRVYMARIAVVCAIGTMVMVLGAYAGSRVAVSAAQTIHKAVVQKIIRAPIDRFFDKQPVGRLVNRLSADLRQVDDAVNSVVSGLMNFFLGFMVVQSWILTTLPWWMALVSCPFFVTIFFFMYVFRGTAVPLTFFVKFKLSEVHDLQGIVLTTCISIRANGMETKFAKQYMRICAQVIRASYLASHACKAWAQSRVFLAYGSLSTMFAIAGLWSGVPLGTLQLVIALSFMQMADFENASTMFVNLINVFNSVQRLTKFLAIPQEAPEDLPSDPKVRRRVLLNREDLADLELRPLADTEGEMNNSSRSTITSTSTSNNTEGDKKNDGGKGLSMVCQKGKAPILRPSAGKTALELLPGRRLRDLAPASEALRELGDEGYDIIGVNSICQDADLMAQELCSPQATLWLDLWCSRYAKGMRIQLEDLCAGYGSEKNVLSNLTVDIAPQTKVGIAGSTGCGKSTTMLCLLRVLEPRGGRILLSGLDTQKIGLSSLRSMIGLVPQDPTVFEGTWRYNIDPFNEFPDGCVWEAFRNTQLLSLLRSLPGGLEAPIAKEGGNLSVGQRQLLSLARMVIRQPPVLLLDECTSALDPSSQEAVQSTLLNAFPWSTIVAIAHRVETILDFDRVVVLDAGVVAENGTVQEVLQMDGIFANMVKKNKKA